MTTAQKHVLAIVLLPYGWIVCALALFYLGPPLYKPAEYWIPEIYSIKDGFARDLPSPKIVLLAGSNTLFGVHAPLLEEKTGLPVLNLGVHVNLPWPYLLHTVRRWLQPGDVLVLPLEYECYARTAEHDKSAWVCRQFSTWGRQELAFFPWREQAAVLARVLPSYPLRLDRLGQRLPVRPQEELLTLVRTADRVFSPVPYQADAATLEGEFFVDGEPTPAVREMARQGLDYGGQPEPSAYALEQLDALMLLARQRGASVFFTYPVSIRNPDYDLSRPAHRRRLEVLEEAVRRRGGKFIGDPALSNMDVRYFLDTSYHLNAEGALLRTLYLADAVRSGPADGAARRTGPEREAWEAACRAEAEQRLAALRRLQALRSGDSGGR